MPSTRRSPRLAAAAAAPSSSAPCPPPPADDDDPEYHSPQVWVDAASGEVQTTDMEEDSDEEEEEEEDTDAGAENAVVMIDRRLPRTLAGLLSNTLFRYAARRERPSLDFPPLPKTWPKVETDISRQVRKATAPMVKRRPFQVQAEGEEPTPSVQQLLSLRECNHLGNNRPGLSAPQQRYLCSSKCLPRSAVRLVDGMRSRAYIGQFSHDGSLFFAAFQHERRIKVYDTRDWSVVKNVHARNLRWTVTDTALSPDGRHLLYSSITPVANLVSVAEGGEVESEANVSDIHEEIPFNLLMGEFEASGGGFGIWSICWAPNGQDILAGTGKNSLDIFNLEHKRCISSIEGHRDDVNAVAFVSDAASDVVASGSDDCTLKVWDRRVRHPSRGAARPEGYLPGHVEGITHIDAMGDGVHLLSTAKDQTSKLWDLRKASNSPSRAWERPFDFDYRWNSWPATGKLVQHPDDCSLQTYRGHKVLQTLIRAYFSPQATTGQRFVYAGSGDGTVRIWDLVSAVEVGKLAYHKELVRDCSWHPQKSDQLVTVSWDGTVVEWGGGKGGDLPSPGYDSLEDNY